jgi:hypothetical protein
MREIIYRDEKFLFETYKEEIGIFIEFKTVFYDPTPIVTKRKKWIFFGEEIEILHYEPIFRVNIDITNHNHSKEFVRDEMDKSYSKLLRKKEIEKGEII